MKWKWTIYLLRSKRGRPLYVGVSRNIARRMNEHRNTLGYKPLYEILQTGKGEGWSKAEKKWIAYFGGPGVLLNKTHGGNGPETLSSETKALLSKLSTGRYVSEETRAKMSRSGRGIKKNFSPEGRAVVLANLKKGQAKGLKKKLTSEQRARQLAILAEGRIARQNISPERQLEINRKISLSRLSKPAEVRAALARIGGVARAAQLREAQS